MLERRRRISSSILQTLPVVVSNYDGPAQLPGARLDAFKAWASPIPDFSSIPTGRRITVAANTGTSLLTAVNSAAALTGGDRLVIVPTGFDAQVALVLPTNAEPSSTVHIAWADMVDGTRPAVRWRRIPITTAANGVSKSGPIGMPRLRSQVSGTGNQGSVITMPKNALCTQYKFYGLEIRMNTGLSATNALDYAYALIDYGDSTTSGAYNVATMPGYMLFSHCVMGGRALTDDNKWRPYNLGRMIYDNGKGCGILDSYNVEHGAQGGYGSDRGIWNGVAAQGPVWIKNNATDFGGGISLMYGGADPPVGTPNCEDIEISHNWMVRDQVYNPSNMTKRYVDALGGTCTWTSKNQFETKGGKRTYVHHNVFEGFWMDGQLAQIMLKAANQETGNNDPDNTVDLAFVDNLCVGGGIGINISTRESNIAYTINGIRHLQVGRNVVLCGLTTTYPSTYGALSCHAMQIGFGSSAQPAGCLDTEDISFLNNATEVSGEAGGLGATLFVTSVVFGPVGKSVSYNRNVSMQVYPQLYTEIRADSGSFGTNYVFDAARYRAGTVVTVADNVSARAAESNGSAFNSAQYFVADLAAMGLTKTALLGEYVQSPTSFLRTGGVGGVRIGPDYDMLNALRPFIISGNLV